MAAPKVFKVVGSKRVPDDYKPAPGEVIRYRFVVDIGEDPKTGKRKQLTRTYDGRREAEKELAKILNETNRGVYVLPAKLTLGEYLDEWLRSATRGRADNTYEAYSNGLKPARERLGKKPLQKVTTKDVEDLADWMLTEGRKRGGKPGTGLSPRCVQITLSKLRAALDSAVHRRLVEFNVAAPVKCPPQKKVIRPPWSPEEVKAFIGSLGGNRLHAPAMLSLMGIGPAELCGERWAEDVDLEAETIQVADNTRTMTWGRSGGQVVEKDGKTFARKRRLPLPPQLTSALKTFKATQAAEKLAAGAAYEPTGYVLVDEIGQPFKTDQWRRAMYKLMADAKVRKVRPYDARHACLTYLAVNGVPDVVVSAWAGHADLTTAKRHYVHPSADDLKQAADKLTELFG